MRGAAEAARPPLHDSFPPPGWCSLRGRAGQSARYWASRRHCGRVAACCAAYVVIRNSRAPARVHTGPFGDVRAVGGTERGVLGGQDRAGRGQLHRRRHEVHSGGPNEARSKSQEDRAGRGTCDVADPGVPMDDALGQPQARDAHCALRSSSRSRSHCRSSSARVAAVSIRSAARTNGSRCPSGSSGLGRACSCLRTATTSATVPILCGGQLVPERHRVSADRHRLRQLEGADGGHALGGEPAGHLYFAGRGNELAGGGRCAAPHRHADATARSRRSVSALRRWHRGRRRACGLKHGMGGRGGDGHGCTVAAMRSRRCSASGASGTGPCSGTARAGRRRPGTTSVPDVVQGPVAEHDRMLRSSPLAMARGGEFRAGDRAGAGELVPVLLHRDLEPAGRLPPDPARRGRPDRTGRARCRRDAGRGRSTPSRAGPSTGRTARTRRRPRRPRAASR